MQDPSETFYRARTNTISMLIDRGYKDQSTGRTEDLQNRYISYDEFLQLFQVGGIAMDLAGIVTPEGLPVYVKFVCGRGGQDRNCEEITTSSLYSKDGSGIFSDIAHDAFQKEHIKHDPEKTDLRKFLQEVKVIVVFTASRNNKNKFKTDVEKSFTMPDYPNIELWPVHRLQCNYANHILVKPHRILSEIEKQAVLHRFNLNVSMMPEMCIDDPLNRWYNGHPGDVYKVSRGTAPHYVIVVSRKMPLSG